MNEQRNRNLSPEARRDAIIEVLEREGEQSAESLGAYFAVSGMTIRRDLAILEQRAKVIRTHGGAALAGGVSFAFAFLERGRQQAEEKEQIAALAVARVTPGQTVLLDSGTTTLAISRQLRSIRPLTVLTSSLPIASELFGCDRINTFLLGGQLRQDSPDLLGSLAERMIENFHADIAFLGADGVGMDGSLYNAVPEVGCLLQKMAAAAETVYAVADHTKVGRTELMRFAHLNDYAGLITDSLLDAQIVKNLKHRGITVIQPEPREADDRSVNGRGSAHAQSGH